MCFLFGSIIECVLSLRIPRTFSHKIVVSFYCSCMNVITHIIQQALVSPRILQNLWLKTYVQSSKSNSVLCVWKFHTDFAGDHPNNVQNEFRVRAVKLMLYCLKPKLVCLLLFRLPWLGWFETFWIRAWIQNSSISFLILITLVSEYTMSCFFLAVGIKILK